MTDVYTQVVNTPVGRVVTQRVGLPQPARLRRDGTSGAKVASPVVLGGAPGGRLGTQLGALLGDAGAKLARAPSENGAQLRAQALVFDATGISDPAQLQELQVFFAAWVRSLEPCGRAVVLGSAPDCAGSPSERIAQRALEGFTRSLAKELRHGATAQLVYVRPGGDGQLASTMRFLLSPRAAYVSGQVIVVGPAGEPPAEIDWLRPQAGRVALVTGASRGIGASIVTALARDGAHVVGLDVPALAEDLQTLTRKLGGSALALDITAQDAPQRIAEHLRDNHEGVDVVVHNAGITRDKTIGRMDAERWNRVIDVNLRAPQLITDALIDVGSPQLRAGGRVVCVSSISGIAGNAGQTNYATSKAGLIGFVDAYAPLLAARQVTINAVAPGFIETQMTANMPFALREAGRRMNSLSQGGLPVDVAEAVAWLASPASGGLNGNVVRVCGQSLLGA